MKLRPVAEVLKHPIEDSPGIRKLALLQVRDRECETGIEVIRTEFQGHSKFGGSLVVFAKGKIGLTQQAVRAGTLGIEGDGPIEGLKSFVELTCLEVSDGEV